MQHFIHDLPTVGKVLLTFAIVGLPALLVIGYAFISKKGQKAHLGEKAKK